MSQWRSLLFVAANDQKRLARAHERGADALILDLEDAVAAQDKAAARKDLPAALDMLARHGCDIVVRINSAWRDAVADLAAAIAPGVRAIMVPKTEDSGRLTVISDIIGDFEREKGLPEGGVGVIALIESPAGLRRIGEIATADRVIGLALGSEDLALAIGRPPSPALLDMPARQMAMAAAETGVMALAIPISIAEFRDKQAYESAAQLGHAYGCTGAICIHPDQAAIANRIFGVSALERIEAEAIWAAWQTARQAGHAVTSLNGRMIDAPVAERARRIMALGGS